MSDLLNKSFVTNIVSVGIIAAGLSLDEPVRSPVLNVGLFAFSGGITNWLAIYMLFERVPGLYGSGVIPARFEEFKLGIRNLIMDQFFTKENIERFFENDSAAKGAPRFDFGPIITSLDLNPAFDGLTAVIQESSLGGMLNMFGGAATLEPLREPFLKKMKESFKEIAESRTFHEIVHKQMVYSTASHEIHEKVVGLVQKRLDELTPRLVKEIIQKMIREHLGWLVVWGGVFGGFIGLAATYMPF